MGDKQEPKNVLKQRAQALECMGKIFMEVGEAALKAEASEADIDGESKKQKQALAQQRVEKAMHDTLEKLDKDEHGE